MRMVGFFLVGELFVRDGLVCDMLIL